MLDKIALLTVKNRMLCLLLSLAFIVFCGWGLQFFNFDGSARAYFEDDYQPYSDFSSIEDRYGKDSRIFIMLAPESKNIFDAESLETLENLTEQSWYLPYVVRVESLANFQHTYSEGDELFVESLVEDAKAYQASDRERIKAIALNDESLVNRLVTPEGDYAAIVMEFGIGKEKQQEKEFELAGKVYDWVAEVEQKHPGLKLYVTGDIISTYNNGMVVIDDLSLMLPAMFALMFIVLGLLMKTVSGVIAAFIIAIAATISGIGLSSWFNLTFSMMSMNAVMIILTVTLAHCIHILNHFFHAYRGAQTSKREALTESIRVNFVPVTITSVTTALGFLTLNTSNMPPAAALGNVSALGVLTSWVFSLTMLPAFIMLFRFKKPTGESGWVEARMIALSGWIIKRKTLLLVSTLVFSTLMGVLALQNTVNDRFSEAISKPHPFRTHNELIDQHFGGLYSFNFDVDSGVENGINDPEYLAYLEAFTLWLREQPDVNSAYSFVDVMKRMNKSMHGDDPAYYKIPESSELAAQLLLLYEMSVPMGLDLNNQLTLDKSASRVIATSASMNTHEVFALQERVNQWQAENFPEHLRKDGASMAVMWSSLSKDSLIASFEGSFIALVVISLVMVVVLRSMRYGLISLVPNIFPAVIGFGIWALISGELGMGLTSVIIITMGIVVDDTVHFLSKYKYAKDNLGLDSEGAVRYSFRFVGTALWTTTFVLVAGFGLLTLSQASMNSQLGLLTSIIILAALLLDFFLLPPLLLLLDKRKKSSALTF